MLYELMFCYLYFFYNQENFRGQKSFLSDALLEAPHSSSEWRPATAAQPVTSSPSSNQHRRPAHHRLSKLVSPLPVSMVNAPPQPCSRPPPDPPPCKPPPVLFESLTPIKPPEPPDPPDAALIFVLVPFVDESHYPSPHMVTQAADLESSVSVVVSEATELSTSPVSHMVATSSEPCSILINQLLRVITVKGISVDMSLPRLFHYETHVSNSAIRALFVPLLDICVDVSILVLSILALWLAVLKPLSLQYAALQSLEDCTLDVGTLAVGCFVATVLLNVYSSDAFHRLASGYRVHLAQSLLSVSCYRVHLAQNQSQAQGKAKEANKVTSLHQDWVRKAPSSHLDSSFISCMTEAAWNKDKLTTRLGWVFSGPGPETPNDGSLVESFISSQFIVEAIMIRLVLCMALTLEFSTLKVLSDSLTLIRAISGNLQSKEIIGIVKDIQSISSEFATIYFSHFSSLTKKAKALQPFLFCNGLHELSSLELNSN